MAGYTRRLSQLADVGESKTGVLVTFCPPSIYAVSSRTPTISSFYLVLFGSVEPFCFTPNMAQAYQV
jgi:hypothetical protein